jgi:hypothetical protein
MDESNLNDIVFRNVLLNVNMSYWLSRLWGNNNLPNDIC